MKELSTVKHPIGVLMCVQGLAVGGETVVGCQRPVTINKDDEGP